MITKRTFLEKQNKMYVFNKRSVQKKMRFWTNYSRNWFIKSHSPFVFSLVFASTWYNIHRDKHKNLNHWKQIWWMLVMFGCKQSDSGFKHLPSPASQGHASTYKSPLTCAAVHFSPRIAFFWHDRILVSRSSKQQPEMQSCEYEHISPGWRPTCSSAKTGFRLNYKPLPNQWINQLRRTLRGASSIGCCIISSSAQSSSQSWYRLYNSCNLSVCFFRLYPGLSSNICDLLRLSNAAEHWSIMTTITMAKAKIAIDFIFFLYLNLKDNQLDLHINWKSNSEIKIKQNKWRKWFAAYWYSNDHRSFRMKAWIGLSNRIKLFKK